MKIMELILVENNQSLAKTMDYLGENRETNTEFFTKKT
jgi:hypothetical protein